MNIRNAAASILIVDDHPIVRQGYAQLIGNHEDLDVCGSAASKHEALAEIKRLQPNLAVVDISLKDSHGLELIKEIRLRFPNVKMLVVSAHDEHLFAERSLEAGALGYINKQEATDRLIEGIRRVLSDEIFVSEEIAKRLLRHRMVGRRTPGTHPIQNLTDRELEVFQMIAHGATTRNIAAKLGLSPKTIERYKENIKLKLNLANSTELVQQATAWLLENGE